MIKAVFFILAVVLMASITHANDVTYLSFFTVKKTCGDCREIEFEPGKSVFPGYKMHWLPDDFLVKKSPEVKFSSADISHITIEQIFISGTPGNFLISIKLVDSASKVFDSYVGNNVGVQALIKINNRVLNVVTIQAALGEEEFTFVVRGFEYKDLLSILEPLSVKITLVNG